MFHLHPDHVFYGKKMWKKLETPKVPVIHGVFPPDEHTEPDRWGKHCLQLFHPFTEVEHLCMAGEAWSTALQRWLEQPAVDGGPSEQIKQWIDNQRLLRISHDDKKKQRQQQEQKEAACHAENTSDNGNLDSDNNSEHSETSDTPEKSALEIAAELGIDPLSSMPTSSADSANFYIDDLFTKSNVAIAGDSHTNTIQ